MNNGDQNTNNFHNFVKIRQHRNRIIAIKDNAANIFIDLPNIEYYFLNYYKNLWSSEISFTLDQLLHIMPDDFAIISVENRDALIKPVSKGEIFHTLKSRSHGKRPRRDGMRVDLFIFYWNIIFYSFFKTVSHFLILLKCLTLGAKISLLFF